LGYNPVRPEQFIVQDFFFKRANLTRLMKQKLNQFKKVFGPKAEALAERLAVKTYTSIIKPSSRFFNQIFEFKKIKQAFGSLMIVSVLAMAVFPASLSAVQTTIETNQAQIQIDPAAIQTEQSVSLPLDSFRITQGFHLFHPAIDLAAPAGTPVYAIMEGYVEEIVYSRWGYGNHIYVNHGNGMSSLYAHLGKIEVKKNEFLNRGSLIGQVGSTGWSSGPHLHLQIWEGGKLINPKTFFESYFGQKLVSTR